MGQRLEQLFYMKNLCLNELKQAQSNCERYSSNLTVMTEYLTEYWLDTNCFLTEYDTCVSNITSIIDAARKFNLHLHLNSMKLSKKNGIFSFKKPKPKESQSAIGHDETLKENWRHYYPVEEYDISSEVVEDFVYPALCLSEVYKTNDVISGTVTYIKNVSDMIFYIVDNSSKYRTAVVELSKCLELRQYQGMPSTFEVFGCVLDNQIFRAVLSSKTFYDVEMNEKVVPSYILDTGEILPIKSGHIMYKLTDDQRNFPALALPCKLLTTNKNPFMTEEAMQDKLKQLEYNKSYLKIVAIENNTLLVEIMDNPKIESQRNNLQNHTVVDNVLERNLNKVDQLQLTEEELNMIYEEPLNTSNAMKAVMGYDPQDDKRICRFYNPSTGGCFKGVNCKLEHTLRQPDGWTKDILPTSSISDYHHPIAIFTPDTIINITPTYVGQLDRFFAQINEPHKTCSPLVFNEEDVPSWKILKKPPHMFELVLSRYIDGLWYRAKIISHDDDYKMFKVFYIDYGNVQVVHLSNLASIDSSIAQVPIQAVLCRFENVYEKPISVEEHKKCIEMLCEMILNKSMDVKVISHYEDLFVSFVDRKIYPLPDILIEMGYLELNNNKILL